MASLGKIWYRWAPTVRCDRNSRCPSVCWSGRVFGLCERFFLAVTYVWLVLVALQLAVKAA